MKTEDIVYIGIDVSKETLDSDAGHLGALKIVNASADIRKALKGFIQKAGGRRLQVCLESTGYYIKPLVEQCRAMGIPCSVLNPYKIACFAKAVAWAKTDAIDASLIRRYSEARRPAPTPAPRQSLLDLDALVGTRSRIVKTVTEHKVARDAIDCRAALAVIKKTLRFLDRQLADCDRLIAEAVRADEEVAGLVEALDAVKGVGTLTAVTVAVAMPEIGRLGRRKVAALAGLAPRTRESGQWKGKARIGGGRKQARDALFMPAAVAIRHDPVMQRLHEREMSKGKPYKVAITAAMRRLLCHLESVAKDYYARRGEKPA
jgi:transposase